MNNYLNSEQEWKKQMSELETDFNTLETNKERAKRKLTQAITNSIKEKTAPNFGILFSGGVDSSLIAIICKQLNSNFTCYTVGLENSQDIEAAKKVAEKLNLNLKTKILTLEEFETIIKTVTNILKEPDVTKVGVASVFYSAAELAKKDNINALFSGLGSEELFTGYQRHEESFTNFESVHKECWNGLKNMWKRDIERDTLIAKDQNINLKIPFLDLNVIKTAMSIHPMHKISKEQNKIILREIAKDLGLEEFADRKKKAAQYGSNFIKGIDKLAKKHNFQYKKEYLKTLL